MGYERNDRWSGDNRYGRNRDDDRNRSYGRADYDRGQDRGGRPSGYDYDDRGFFDRAGDEVRSWFGDEEAERRRRYDERYDDRYAQRDDQSYGRGSHDGGRSLNDRGYGQRSYGGQSQGSGYGARSYGDQGGQSGRGYGDRYSQGNDVSGYAWGGGQSGRQSPDHRSSTHTGDDHYRSWRDRQMDALDRDYDEYRRENQSRFETEFSSYRTKRQSQRGLVAQVQEHAEVVGSDGQHVGKVDHVQGDQLKLAKNDQDAGGKHHFIPSSWIESVEGNQVKISKTADEAKRHWREESSNDDNRGGGLFGGRDDNRSSGNLNRSFSGTY